jgi:hypothetical protein
MDRARREDNFTRDLDGLCDVAADALYSSQIPFPANSNQYRFNNEFLINQKL